MKNIRFNTGIDKPVFLSLQNPSYPRRLQTERFKNSSKKETRKMKRKERFSRKERILRCSLPILVETRVIRPRHAMHFRETFSFPSAAIREEDGETKPLVSHVSRHFQQEINAPSNQAAPNRALCQSIVVEQWKSLESRGNLFPSPHPRLDLAFSSLYRVSLLSKSRGLLRSSFRLTFDPENIFNFVKRSFTCAPVSIQYNIALHA